MAWKLSQGQKQLILLSLDLAASSEEQMADGMVRCTDADDIAFRKATIRNARRMRALRARLVASAAQEGE